MARIRSIHPGQYADEDFIDLSAYGKLMAIGIRNETDDHGIFEWKPKTLKRKLYPDDQFDVEAVMAELANHNIVMSYEIEGRRYGAVRNFLVYQTPKKPTYIYPITPLVEEYIGFSRAKSRKAARSSGQSSPPVPNQSTPEKNKERDKEEEREREKENKTEPTSITAPVPREAGLGLEELEGMLRKAAGWESDPSPGLFITGPILALIEGGASLEADVLPVVRARAPKARQKDRTWKYFYEAIKEARDLRLSMAGPSTRAAENKPANGAMTQAEAAAFLENHTAKIKSGARP